MLKVPHRGECVSYFLKTIIWNRDPSGVGERGNASSDMTSYKSQNCQFGKGKYLLKIKYMAKVRH